MCEPATIGLIASMALTAYAGAENAEAQADAANYSARVSEKNAKLDDFRAEQAGRIGAVNEERHRQKVRGLVGTQRANAAANGIDLGSGTVEAMLDETVTMGEADALTIRFNAMNEAWGHRVSASNKRNDARMTRFGGKNARRGTYLTTAANVAGMGYQGYANGTFGGGGG